jgi:hypothetical protein
LNIMGLNKSGRLAIAERRAKVASLYLLHHTQRQIAEALGCSLGTVNSDLKAVEADWKERAALDLQARKAEELAGIDNQEREYWEQWEESKKPVKKGYARTIRGKGGDRTEVREVEESRDGDPCFLAGVQRCIDQRCKLLGLYDLRWLELERHVRAVEAEDVSTPH